MCIQNFINFSEFEDAESMIHSMAEMYYMREIDLDNPQIVRLYLEEERTELYDDRLNFMGLTDPEVLHYMNMDKVLREMPQGWASGAQTTLITLSKKVTLHKRIVYDTFMMLGDIGGLLDFIFLVLAAIFGFLSEKRMVS